MGVGIGPPGMEFLALALLLGFLHNTRCDNPKDMKDRFTGDIGPDLLDMFAWTPQSKYSQQIGKRDTPNVDPWSPESRYSRVPGKRQISLDLDQWGPESPYSRVIGKRSQGDNIWTPESWYSRAPEFKYSRVLGKKEDPSSGNIWAPESRFS